MLSTMKSSWLLFTLFALFAFASALNIGDINLDGIEEYLNHGVKRQAQGTGNSQTTPTPAPTSNAPTSPPPSFTPAPEPAPTSPNEPSNTPTLAPSSQPPPSSQSPGGSTTSRAPSPRPTTPVIETTPLVTSSIKLFTTMVTIQSNGQDILVSSTGSSTVVSTTGLATHTKLPETQNGEASSGGLSNKNKTIIGGVVGGVGGALLLGGIALVCWRMWGKKNRVKEDDADLVAGTGSALGDKSYNNNTSPFQSNLEQYHNPGGRPNAAANF